MTHGLVKRLHAGTPVVAGGDGARFAAEASRLRPGTLIAHAAPVQGCVLSTASTEYVIGPTVDGHAVHASHEVESGHFAALVFDVLELPHTSEGQVSAFDFLVAGESR